MKKLDLNLKLGPPDHASGGTDVPNATSNHVSPQSLLPNFNFSSPRSNIPKGVETDLRIGGSSGGVNQQYGYGDPNSNTAAGMPWLIPGQLPINPTNTVVGIPAAIYMNQPLLLPPPPFPAEGSGSNFASAAFGPAPVPAALAAFQANFSDEYTIHRNPRCSLCNTLQTPMWRRGPFGPKSLCNACGIKFQKEEKRMKERKASTSGTK